MIPGQTNTLDAATITGTIHSGLTLATTDGRKARLAIIDEDGNILASGRPVERECWNVVLQVHSNFLAGRGYLTVHSTPPGLPHPAKAAA